MHSTFVYCPVVDYALVPDIAYNSSYRLLVWVKVLPKRYLIPPSCTPIMTCYSLAVQPYTDYATHHQCTAVVVIIICSFYRPGRYK